MLIDRRSVTRTFWFERATSVNTPDWITVTEALATLLESGDVEVVIDKTYPLSEAAKAVAHMLGHHARGKVVITVDDNGKNQHDTTTRSV